MSVIVGPVLPEAYFEQVESIWDDLVDEFGIERFRNPYPHFTLYALDSDTDVQRVEEAITAVASKHEPCSVHTAGVGVFPGNHVWIPVARSEPIATLHREVVDAVSDLGTAPVPFYEPHRWFPHIGLALSVGDELAGDIASFLLDYDLQWRFTVDNVGITRAPAEGEEYELVASVSL